MHLSSFARPAIEGHVNETGPGRHIGQIRHPQPVRPIGGELTRNQSQNGASDNPGAVQYIESLGFKGGMCV